jgi:serine/threonine protein kinase
MLDRLTAALSDRYTVERELGAGGMATVYLAEDLKHHRKVEVTAQLNHPHILPKWHRFQASRRQSGALRRQSEALSRESEASSRQSRPVARQFEVPYRLFEAGIFQI